MILTLIIFSSLATIILWYNPRNSAFRWFSAALYAASACIAVFLMNESYPAIPNAWINNLIFITDVAVAFSSGMFGVIYSRLYNRKKHIIIAVIGLSLIIIAWMLTPMTPTRKVNYEGLNEVPVVIFVSIFNIFGIISMIVAYFKEKHPYKKIERMLTNLLVVPSMTCVVVAYILYTFEIDLFQANYLFAIAMAVIFFAIGAKKSIMGVKIKIEMIKADASVYTLNNSTSVLNHTIKNEIGKIDILLHQIRQAIPDRPLPDSTDAEIAEMTAMASNSVQHLQTMMNTVNEKLKAIEVRLQRGNLSPIIEQCLSPFEKTAGPSITFRTNLKSVSDVYLDPTHIKEVIMNLLSNAIEALDHQGEITLSLSENKKAVVLEIRDSGKGIPAETISSIFDPFYTTKNLKSHYGLGLFYCKNVIQKHHGAIHADSTPGHGSSFYLTLKK